MYLNFNRLGIKSVQISVVLESLLSTEIIPFKQLVFDYRVESFTRSVLLKKKFKVLF